MVRIKRKVSGLLVRTRVADGVLIETKLKRIKVDRIEMKTYIYWYI